MNSVCKVLLLFVSLTCFLHANAQTSENEIDKQLQQCLDSSQNSSTIGMIECTTRAKDAWDKELNKYYQLLMQSLSKDEKSKLRTAQLKWLAFRNSENNFSTTMYRNMQGTMWGLAKIQSDLNIIKQRALELKAYYADKSPK